MNSTTQLNKSERANKPLLEIEELKMYFPVNSGFLFRRKTDAIKAVDGISFSVEEKETFGLVGESGCGKSTTGRAVLQLYRPTSGNVHMYRQRPVQDQIKRNLRTDKAPIDQGYYEKTDLTKLRGKNLRSYRRHMQMIFQDPYASLNPRMNIGSIISEPMAIHNLHKGNGERKKRTHDLLDKVGLNPFFARRYPHEFSGGQRQRIAIARALAVEPRFIVADEPVSALDVSIQAQIINLLEDLQMELGITYLLIAHDLSIIRHTSRRTAVMYLGKIVELTETQQLFATPLHPYTQALLSAVPIPDPRTEQMRNQIILTGDVPSPFQPPSGCNFHPRCPIATELCKTEEPIWREAAPGHSVKCHHV